MGKKEEEKKEDSVPCHKKKKLMWGIIELF